MTPAETATVVPAADVMRKREARTGDGTRRLIYYTFGDADAPAATPAPPPDEKPEGDV